MSRHPSERKGATIQAEELWNDWITVNDNSNCNGIPVDTAKTMMRQKDRILTRVKDSVLNAESEKERSEAQAGEEKQDTLQPIKSKHGRIKNNAAEIIGA